MGEKGPSQSLTSFLLGVAMAVACIVFYMSAYPKGERWSQISSWSDGADIQSLKVMNEEKLALAKEVHIFSSKIFFVQWVSYVILFN